MCDLWLVKFCRTAHYSLFILFIGAAGALQMVFEEYGFASFAAVPAQPLSLRAWAAERPAAPAAAAGVGLVVDAGFSFTHAVPLCDGRVLWPAVRRINLGGKALTNYFKELVSYRCGQQPAVSLNFSRPFRAGLDMTGREDRKCMQSLAKGHRSLQTQDLPQHACVIDCLFPAGAPVRLHPFEPILISA